jgi:hypothetical protein
MAMILKASEQSIETRRRIAEILSRTMPIPEPAEEPEHLHEQDCNIGDDQDGASQEAEGEEVQRFDR